METITKHRFALRLRYLLASILFIVFTLPLAGQSSAVTINIDGVDYKIEASSDKGVCKIKMTDGDQFNITRTTNYFTLNNFKNMVVNEHINNLKAQRIASGDSNPLAVDYENIMTTDLSRSLSDSFLELISILNNIPDSGQKIAEITLMDTVYLRDKEDSIVDTLKVNSAQLVFEDGTIKNIIIEGTNGAQEQIIFSNLYSIGITTRANVLNFTKIRLNPELSDIEKNLKLSDVLIYKRKVDLRTNDFSPADVALVLYPNKSQELFKAPSAKLFQLNLFSDFVGLNENNPNGLVQAEFTKRINLWTKRTSFWPFNKLGGVGVLSHMTPDLQFTKIEENNRSIGLSQFNNIGEITYFLNPLELYRHNYVRISNEVNLLDLQGASVSFHMNAFGGIGITNVKDTVEMNGVETSFDENVNTLMYGANLKLLFNPESRWSYQLSSKFNKLEPLSDNFLFASVEQNEFKEPNDWVTTWEFLLSWNTGADNQIFGRFRFNHELKYLNNNFTEFQIGYSIFLKTSQVAGK